MANSQHLANSGGGQLKKHPVSKTSNPENRSNLVQYIIHITIFIFIIMVLSFWGNVFLCKLSQYFQKWLWSSPDQRKCYRKKNGQNKQHLLTLFDQHFQYNREWKHTIWNSDFKTQIVVDLSVLLFKTSQVKYIWVIMRLVSFKWVAAEISCGKKVLSWRISKRAADR